MYLIFALKVKNELLIAQNSYNFVNKNSKPLYEICRISMIHFETTFLQVSVTNFEFLFTKIANIGFELLIKPGTK